MRLKTIILMNILFISALLTSCASMNASDNTGQHFQVIAPSSRQAALSSVHVWIANGAFSIQQNKKAEIANYQWRQFGAKQYRIQIVSAMGLYTAWIYAQVGSVTFWKNGTEVSTAKTPEGLMQNALGWSLPIGQLRYWIKGMIAPDKTMPVQAKYDAYGHLISLEQSGWLIQWSQYREVERIDLPRVIVLSRPGLLVKIVVKDWFLPMHPFGLPTITS